MKMTKGFRYVVTKPSKNGEFRTGDHIWMMDNGAIMNSEAGGWMMPENVADATEGMEVKLDAEYAARLWGKVRQMVELARHELASTDEVDGASLPRSDSESTSPVTSPRSGATKAK